MWACYRFARLVAASIAICGCGALRVLVGPDKVIFYPPGKVTSLGEAIFCWCLWIVVMAMCTPRNRARWWEAWMVVPLATTPLGLPSNVSGTPTLGLYQPRALCAVAPPLLPGLRGGGDANRVE
eukprot:scaffold11521_cov68-Phaeocystis_antarctica.AAC.2